MTLKMVRETELLASMPARSLARFSSRRGGSDSHCLNVSQYTSWKVNRCCGFNLQVGCKARAGLAPQAAHRLPVAPLALRDTDLQSWRAMAA